MLPTLLTCPKLQEGKTLAQFQIFAISAPHSISESLCFLTSWIASKESLSVVMWLQLRAAANNIPSRIAYISHCKIEDFPSTLFTAHSRIIPSLSRAAIPKQTSPVASEKEASALIFRDPGSGGTQAAWFKLCVLFSQLFIRRYSPHRPLAESVNISNLWASTALFMEGFISILPNKPSHN